jgi:Dolichyl-phosphate-mannose-protein mannosyltransferase
MLQSIRPVVISIISSLYFVPICFTVYLSLRIAVISIPIDLHSDALWYYERAVALASGEGYSMRGFLTAYWPVGWPGFLGLLFWLFGASPFVGVLANLIFTVMMFGLVLCLASTIFTEKLIGRAAVAILSIYPNQIAYISGLETEIFYTTLLLIAILLYVWSHRLMGTILCGFLFGIATLTKPQTIFVPIALFVGWWLLDRGRGLLALYLRDAAAVYVAMAVVILPWTARNYLVFGEFVLVSTNGGATLLTGNNPSAWGDYTENDALVRQAPFDLQRQVDSDRLATSLALRWIHDNPVSFAILIPRKIWRLWAPDGEAEWGYQAGFKYYDKYWLVFRAIRVLNQLYYIVMMALFVVSIHFYVRQHKEISPFIATGYILVTYFTMISIVFSGQSRFHFPLMPWIAMYAAWTIIQWAGRGEVAPTGYDRGVTGRAYSDTGPTEQMRR